MDTRVGRLPSLQHQHGLSSGQDALPDDAVNIRYYYQKSLVTTKDVAPQPGPERLLGARKQLPAKLKSDDALKIMELEQTNSVSEFQQFCSECKANA